MMSLEATFRPVMLRRTLASPMIEKIRAVIFLADFAHVVPGSKQRKTIKERVTVNETGDHDAIRMRMINNS